MSEYKYGVRFSGHGSSFVPDKYEDGVFFRYDSWLEANQVGLEWELRADTIGGRAEIVREDGVTFNVKG